MRFSARLTARITASFALCALAAPAQGQSPATAASEYEAARGAPFGDSETVAFEILQTPLDAVGGGQSLRIEARLGAGWAAWSSGDGAYTLVDMVARRRLSVRPGEATLENTSLYAEARRRLDIYAGLSRGGQAEMISFGDAGEFDRTWLEAAMGLAANENVLEITETETGFDAYLKDELVFSADYGARAEPVDEDNQGETPDGETLDCGTPDGESTEGEDAEGEDAESGIADAETPGAETLDAETAGAEISDDEIIDDQDADSESAEGEIASGGTPEDETPVDEAVDDVSASVCDLEPLTGDAAASARTLVRHAAPLHPDIMARLAQDERFPCAFDFLVYSPESPNGRRESWVLDAFKSDEPVLPADLEIALPLADLIGEAGQAALAAVRGDAPDAPDAISFFETAADLRSEGDLAGAFLTTTQETHNFGPCPTQTVGSGRLACQEVRALTAAGIGDANFERALEGTAAVRENDHATAVERLSVFIDREDAAGAAARILVANELVAWGREGLESRPDLDPAALLSEAIMLDPHAPDAYWHLARRYLEAGAPHAAWVFLDLGRALPGRDATPLLAQADALEQRLAALAPDWTGPADLEIESTQD